MSNPIKQISLSTFLLWLLPCLLFLFYIAPLGGVLGWSVTRPDLGLQNYSRIIFDENVVSVLIRTFRVCLFVTIISVTAAYILAYHWVFGPARRRLILELCIFIPFWISVLIRAFGWVIVLRTKGVANDALMWMELISEPLYLVRTEFSVILGMVHFLIPFAVFPLASVMRQVNPNILLASRGMGAKPSFTFTQVFFPLTIPGILASVIIVLVFSLGFFITPAILGGGKIVLIAEYIYIQMFQTTNWGFGAALSVALLMLVTLLIGMLFRIIKPEKLVS